MPDAGGEAICEELEAANGFLLKKKKKNAEGNKMKKNLWFVLMDSPCQRYFLDLDFRWCMNENWCQCLFKFYIYVRKSVHSVFSNNFGQLTELKTEIL